MRRVDMEIRSGDVPKPDGSIPEVALADGGAGVTVRSKIEQAIEERESKISELEAEVQELRFVLDTIDSLEEGDGLPEIVVDVVEEGSQ
jgi:prefoldin subunit 5